MLELAHSIVLDVSEPTDDELVKEMDELHAEVSRTQRSFLALIRKADSHEIWREWGARDLAHFLSIRYSISYWKARRIIKAAHALEHLPLTERAFEKGELGIDKVVELTRLATPETEGQLLPWAKEVSIAAIRYRADVEITAPKSPTEVFSYLQFWREDDGRFMGMQGRFPAARGAAIKKAVEAQMRKLPPMPGDDPADPDSIDARRADALVAICSAAIAQDPDPDRATIVVHATQQAFEATRNAETDDGLVIEPKTLQMLACDARIQFLIEDDSGNVVGLSDTRRNPPRWMSRQLKYRDRGCRFPGCGTKAFNVAHHIKFRGRGGKTALENLVLLCSWHHRAVHELGWGVKRYPSGEFRWFTPDGIRYRAGPGWSPNSYLEDLPEPALIDTS